MNSLYLPKDVRHEILDNPPRAALRLDEVIELSKGVTITQGAPVRVAGTDAVTAYCWFQYPDKPSRGIRVLGSVDRTERFGPLLHLSISRMDRDPTWHEIKLVRAAFFPDTIDVMMVLPSARYYVNIHEHCFHLWKTPTAWAMM